MGHDLDGLFESRYHRKLNNWILSQVGATWFDVMPLDAGLSGEQRSALVDDVGWALTQDETRVFLGDNQNAVEGQSMSLEIPWGWKDPRTTVTLPVWLAQYPDAKIVHVYRHGLDVARSLCVRDARRVKNESTNPDQKAQYTERGRKRQSRGGLDQLTIDEGVELWAEYTRRAKHAVAEAEDRAVEIQYEEFLSDPHGQLEKLAAVYPLSLDRDQVRDLIASINVDRAYSWRRDDELKQFADSHRETLAEFGYGA